jgi:hypothetical protein
MLLEMTHEESQLLAELLRRRLNELGVEEHRSETWRYKEILQHEHAVLGALRGKVQRLIEAVDTSVASTQ